jgi:hypothetical protein
LLFRSSPAANGRWTFPGGVMRFARFLLAGLTLWSGVLSAMSLPTDDTAQIMPFTRDPAPCLQCHSTTDSAAPARDPAKACDAFCLTCHEDTKQHHKVGIQPPGGRPATLQLNSRHEVVCTTCHDLTGRRFDDSPWKYQSLYQRAFRKSHHYRTYYLVLRNDKGQLCRTCH